MRSVRSRFTSLAKTTSRATGRPAAFILALGAILAWLTTGPLFGFSDTWQLVVNTATTVVTFLMVFLIQNTQNRDTEALQIKLDELLRAIAARTTRCSISRSWRRKSSTACGAPTRSSPSEHGGICGTADRTPTCRM